MKSYTYTQDELKQKISKKYHEMIDWNLTFFMGFDGTIDLIDNGQKTTSLPKSLYGSVSNINWYLRRIKENPEIEW